MPDAAVNVLPGAFWRCLLMQQALIVIFDRHEVARIFC
jgi:hypothetical protein